MKYLVAIVLLLMGAQIRARQNGGVQNQQILPAANQQVLAVQNTNAEKQQTINAGNNHGLKPTAHAGTGEKRTELLKRDSNGAAVDTGALSLTK